MDIDWQHHGRTIETDIGLQVNSLIVHLYIGRLSVMWNRKSTPQWPLPGCICDPPSHSGHYSYCPHNAFRLTGQDAPVEHIIEDPRWSEEDLEYQTWCTCGWTAEGDKGGIWYGINQHQKDTGAVLRP